MLFMYLCEVAIVSQLCIFPLYLLHGSVEDYLTCDIAFNAIMPLSRASTRGRYSRIEGVTLVTWGLRRIRTNAMPLGRRNATRHFGVLADWHHCYAFGGLG